MRKIILWSAIVFFIVFFSYLSIKRYKTLNSYYFDLGIMNQVVYNTSRGHFLEMTNQDLKRNTSRLAIHFDPILALFAPFYWIYPNPEVLLIGQAVILGLGAWAIFLIAEELLKKKTLPLLFSILYLLYFAVQRTVIFDFHAVTLATTFFLFSFYFQQTKKWLWFFVFIFLALLTKEHIGLVVFLYGIYLFFVKKERKIGIITTVLGLSFFIITVYFIIPHFRGNEHFALKYFSDIRSRYKDIIINGYLYVKQLLPPVFYSLFSPLTLAVSIPEWLINILSINSNQRSILFHYNSIIVSFLFYSLILGYRNFDRIVKNKPFKNLVFILFIILNLLSIYKYNPVPSFVKHPVSYKDLNPITKSSIDQWREILKDDEIKVSTTPKLAPFFTNRRYYNNFLYDSAYASMGLIDDDIIKTADDYKGSDYILIYRPEIGEIKEQGIPVKFYQRLRKDSDYEIIFSDDLDDKSLEVYKRVSL